MAEGEEGEEGEPVCHVAWEEVRGEECQPFKQPVLLWIDRARTHPLLWEGTKPFMKDPPTCLTPKKWVPCPVPSQWWRAALHWAREGFWTRVPAPLPQETDFICKKHGELHACECHGRQERSGEEAVAPWHKQNNRAYNSSIERTKEAGNLKELPWDHGWF